MDLDSMKHRVGKCKMISILMVEDNVTIQEAFEVAIRSNPHFLLVGKTGKQSEAMKILRSVSVDVMLLDLELEEGDGIHLLEEMQKELSHFPEIITVTNTCSESILSCVRELGSDFIYQKNNSAYSPENVLEIIEMTYPYYQKKQANRQQVLAAEYSIEKEAEYQHAYVQRELEKMGFQPGKRGTALLTEAICILLEYKVPKKVQMTKDVYPVIAEKYGASAGGVEKSIRNAIERTWRQTELSRLTALYPGIWDKETGRPTNTEFIWAMVDKFKNRI